MDPEKIEKKIKELEGKIISEIKLGQSKIKIIHRLTKETNEGAQKINDWKQQALALKELLNNEK